MISLPSAVQSPPSILLATFPLARANRMLGLLEALDRVSL